MSYSKDGYSTTIGSHLVTKHIVENIQKAIVLDNIDRNNLNVGDVGIYKPLFLIGMYNSEADIPLFAHPITIDNFKGNNYLCSDMRLYVSKDADNSNIEEHVKNRTEFNFAKSRAILNLLWLDNNSINKIKNATSFAGTIFASWLSSTITRNYALDAKDQIILSIISSYYYQTLFMTDTVVDEDTKQKLAVHTIKATKAPANLVFEVFDRIGKMDNINDYIENVKNILENIRLKDFSLVVLLTILKNSWFGTNSKEIISIAIEHPPTWISVVYSTITERTYKNSGIYKIVENFGKKGMTDEFTMNYTQLIQDHIAMEEVSLIDSIRSYE